MCKVYEEEEKGEEKTFVRIINVWGYIYKFMNDCSFHAKGIFTNIHEPPPLDPHPDPQSAFVVDFEFIQYFLIVPQLKCTQSSILNPRPYVRKYVVRRESCSKYQVTRVILLNFIATENLHAYT